MRNLERVRYVTKNYDYLQGLKQVPVGIFVLDAALSNSNIWPWYTALKPINTLFNLPLAVGAYLLISIYYKRNFGEVRYASRTDREIFIEDVVPFLALVAAFVVDLAFWPPVSIVGLTVAAWMSSRWWVAGKLSIHHAVAAMLLAVASLTPLTGFLSPERFFGVGMPLVFGVVIIINGVLDHLLLKCSMPLVADESINANR